MSVLDRPRSETPTSAAVVAAAVVVTESAGLAGALQALAGQVYGATAVLVVGGGDQARRAAEDTGATWVSDSRRLARAVPREVTHLWIVHQDARPKPDALGALVRESERVEASVAGSKLLRADHPELLESVGEATDVFGVPYSGLEHEEVDQQQYDVVRDVAFVSAASLLVRADLFRGLGGLDPRLAPEAAGIDLCQRARLAGGRVVVVPSSEVLHQGSCRQVPIWREEAGRLRAILKAYRPLTLAWAVPLAFLSGLVEVLVAPFLGRRRAPIDFAQAWGWNLIHAGGTWRLRRQAVRARLMGDEELFRYQRRGSFRLRGLAGEVSERWRARAARDTSGRLADLVERGQEAFNHPAFVAVLGLGVFVAVAARAIWAGLPLAGFAFPPAPSAWDTLRAYAGGWNVAGLGAPEPLRPAVGVVALVQLAMLGREELAAALLTAGSLVLGMVGTARLLRHLGVGPYARYAAALVLVAGPAAREMMGGGHWTGLMALAVLPWAVSAALEPWPAAWQHLLGRASLLVLLTGIGAAYLTAFLVLPLLAALIWLLVGGGRSWAPGRALLGLVGSVLLLLPWLSTVNWERLTTAGLPAFWVPSWWLLISWAAALAAVLAAGDRRQVVLGGWGGLLAAGGALLARTGSAGPGHEVEVGGLLMSALGSAVVAGVALDLWRQVPRELPGRRVLAAIGLAAGLGLVATTPLLAVNGRVGLPADQLGETLRVTASRAPERGSARLLVLGPPGTLPGDSRTISGTAYRVISAPSPSLWEAWLPEPGPGDLALDELLGTLRDGQTLRVGEALAPFGIRWVVLTGPTPFQAALEAQLDLQPLSGLDLPMYESEVSTSRAIGEDGAPWEWVPPDYRGSPQPDGRVYLAENADHRWLPPPWERQAWASSVSGAAGVIRFGGVPEYRLAAQGAGLWLLLLMVLAWWGRGGR